MQEIDPEIRESVADVTLGFVEEALACDIEKSLLAGLGRGAVFEDPGGPDDLFRSAVARAIRAIHAKDADGLMPQFLAKGPYFDAGEIPQERMADFLSDESVAAAIRFIHSSAINSFQGALAELLAVGPVCAIVERVFGSNSPRVFCGDTVLARKPRIGSWGKAADLHLLDVQGEGTLAEAFVRGVVEVKSYITTPEKLRFQVAQHLKRPSRGLLVQGHEISMERVRPDPKGSPPIEIMVVPSDWALSREICFDRDGDRIFLAQVPVIPPQELDRIEMLEEGRWLVTLRWSQEALASVAYEMTFWYLGQLGQLAYGEDRPRGWEDLPPEEAGREAAKMMLYYSILRARTTREASRAIALFNSYGFGYALGAHFVDHKGTRQELFFEDLEQIAQNGISRTESIEFQDKESGRVRVIPPARCRIR
ncbi:MAG: hypothetical protein IPJ17_15810 [Holophagales bacterium]|nr:MAG: hypothetical protein IPJ17_15810 [Holophagales bacterium]